MKALGAAIFLWLVLGALLLPLFLPLLNPDGTSYVSIAEKYCRGDWANAINGYWGPFLSWLTVPLLGLGIDPFAAAKIVLFLAGIPLLMAVRSLSASLEVGEPLSSILLFACLPIGLYMAMAMITPDFLVAAILLSYLSVFIGDKFPARWTSGALCGVLGALAYLAKPFAFFFFLAHFLGGSGLRALYRRNSAERRPFLAAGLAGLVVFAVLSGTWIGLISHKYHHLLINTAGRYNLAYLRPGSPGQPIETEGFLPPPNPTAYSAWEDPGLIPLPKWSPTQSGPDLAYYLGLLRHNAVEFIKSLDDFSALGPAILAVALVFSVLTAARRFSSRRSARVGGLGLTLILYSFGYGLLLIEDRYLWLDTYLLMIIGAAAVAVLLSRSRARRWLSAAAGTLLLATFMILPARFFPYFRVVSASDTRTPAMATRELAHWLKVKYGLQGRFASNSRWNESLFIAALDHLQYYGQMQPSWSGPQLEAALHQHGLRYFFLWRDNDPKFDFLNGYIELTKGRIRDLKIYRLKKRPDAGHHCFEK
jgi:hypothetical protein